jgi:hypothetical protein
MNLNTLIKKIINYFSCAKYFKFVEEHTQLNRIKSITKDNAGEILIEISPLGSSNVIRFKISDFNFHKNFVPYLSQKDRELIKLLATCEGDVFVESKSFSMENHLQQEVLSLCSIVSNETWVITKEDLLKNDDLMSRLNKKYFKKELTI